MIGGAAAGNEESPGYSGGVPPLRLPFLRPRSRLARLCRERVGRCRGLEIGGPSRIFSAKGRLPLYPRLTALDGVDHGARTLWQHARAPEAGYEYPGKGSPGRLYLEEAGRLAGVETSAYDVVLASHVLEHLANPLGALASWARVLRERGSLVLVVPHREGTFDHRRPVTTLTHLRQDRDRGVGEDDLTHLAEILDRHDLERDPGAGAADAFEARARDNLRHRSLHHHVFDTELVLRVLDETGYGILGVDVMPPYHIAVLAQKGDPAKNDAFLAPEAAWRERSPFAGDRP